MKRILMIRYKKPKNNIFEGGEQCSQKNYRMLSSIFGADHVDVYYVHDETVKRRLSDYLKGVLFFLSNYYFGLTPARVNEIVAKSSAYDAVFIDRSLFGIIAKQLRVRHYPGLIVSFFHNVEKQYFLTKYAHNLFLRKPIAHCADVNDRYACQYSDKIVALNQRDADSIRALYGRKVDVLIPIAFADTYDSADASRTELTSHEPVCLFLGAYFPANVRGIAWFVKNVYPHVHIKMVIAGKGMDKIRKEPYITSDITIYSDVQDLRPLFEQADIMVLPIFEGSGMKVKTCESLMYAKNILGTTEAFEGYELDYAKVGGLCNTQEEFVSYLQEFSKHPRKRYNEYARTVFKQKYSETAVRDSFHSLFFGVPRSKVGIVSWFGESNYGTNLQAYALYRSVSRLGYDCEMVKICFNSDKAGSVKNALYMSYVRLKNRMQHRIFNRCLNQAREANVERFFLDETRFRLVDSHRKFHHLADCYDIFMTGSDQIWNPNYMSGASVLAFAPTHKKLSYASSIGLDNIPPAKLHYYKDYVSQFDYIAVREKTGEQLLSRLLGREDVCTVLDPTFLLTAQEWGALERKAVIPSDVNTAEPFMFCYLVGNQASYESQIKDIKLKSQVSRCIIATSDGRGYESLEGIHFEAAGPYEFLWLISHAALVCTDSFHACTFSLKFKRQFVVLRRFANSDKQSQNSRLEDLFATLGLCDRFYNAEHERWLAPIDFDKVDQVLEPLIASSKAYLETSLQSCAFSRS